ncbi:MAG: tetratricopeptide repeat protein [Maricaulis sp.]|jgi:tetratricopeptide (TPR) repeat protein|nr:tetratricopeptide repeat protein [Maricaulis sp.]MDG2045096.1 tetratricopeptide repeat protein [Maricaulis sp.]
MRRIATYLTGMILLLAPAAQAQVERSVCLEGLLSLQSGNSAEAITQLQTCLDTEELEPEIEADIHSALGAAYLFEERYGEALIEINTTFAIAANMQAEITDGTLWRNRGIARSELNMIDPALDDFQRAAQLTPNDFMVHLNLGILYQGMERHTEAVVAFDRVVQLQPGWVGAWLNRSGALLDAGITAAAVQDARRAVELEPENGSTLNMLCWTLIQDGRAETALPLCEMAVEAEPDIGAIVHSLATAKDRLGENREARRLFARAYRLSPEDPEITADYNRTHNP